MAFVIPVGEPTEVFAGDLIKWKIKEDSNFLIADSYVLSYAFVKAGHKFDITCTDNGDNHHLATITAADSDAIQAGTYKWQSYITKTTERYFVDEGTLIVNPNFAKLGGGYDGRSHWAVVLDAVEAVIQGRATKDQSSYTVAGRQLSRTSIPDLIMLYNKAKAAVVSEQQAENIEKGVPTSNKIYTRFGN